MSRAETLPLAPEPTNVAVEGPHFALATAPTQGDQVFALMARALEMGEPGVAALERLTELHERVQRRNAELEFNRALAKFQQTCPPVPADGELGHLKRVDRNGVSRAVRFATIQGLRDHMQPYLDPLGLGLSFDARVDGDMLTGTATLRHIDGHSQSSSFTLPTAAKTPAMSPQHAYEAAYSFACRIALRSVTGVRVASDDAQAEQEADPTKISEEQGATLATLCDEVKADPAKFLAYLKVQTLYDLPASRYTEAVRALEARRKKA